MISPVDSSILILLPAIGLPTFTSLNSSFGVNVTAPQASVAPYTSLKFSPNFLYHFFKWTGVRAAPVNTIFASASPNATFSLARKKEEINGTESNVLTTSGFILPKIPDWNLLQIRGTAKNTVGCVSFRLSTKVSMDSPNDMEPPLYSAAPSITMRSAT